MAIVDVKVPPFEPGKDHRFEPKDITVQLGDTVKWTNDDNDAHTVTSDTGLFQTVLDQKGATFSNQFDAAGTFPYFCEFHDMSGTVVVVEASAG